MAGWLDRVLVPGVAYRLDAREGLPTSLLRLRAVLVLNTGDTPPERERQVFGDPLDDIWRRCVGAYLGGAAVHRVVASPLGGSTEAEREAWLDEVGRVADAL
jgi:putative NADPH-quinone reductase